jgi:phage pi2 protein 07
MARFRIVQKPSAMDPRRTMYEVQEKEFWWWTFRNVFNDLNEAEEWTIKLIESLERPFVKTCVVGEYK